MAKGDKIAGGLTDKWSVKDVAKKHEVEVSEINKELEVGTNVELEHTKDKSKAREIALDHLYEIPDYYKRLNDMENKAEKEMNEGNENITDYARRMRELAGFAEGSQNKSLKTIQEGTSSFEDGATFYAKDMATPKCGVVKENFDVVVDGHGDNVYQLPFEAKSIEELLSIAENNKDLYSFLSSELGSDEGVKLINGEVFWGADIFDLLKNNKTERESIADMSLNESKEKKEDFEIHKFEQRAIEEGADDEELYSLNENTVIVLDFLNESDDDDDDDEYIDPIKKNIDDYEAERMERKYNSDEWVEAQRNS